jgi:hypothetical protein
MTVIVVMLGRTSCCPGGNSSCACGRHVGFTHAPAGPPFQRLGFLGELDQMLSGEPLQRIAHLRRGGVEKLLSTVDRADPL